MKRLFKKCPTTHHLLVLAPQLVQLRALAPRHPRVDRLGRHLLRCRLVGEHHAPPRLRRVTGRRGVLQRGRLHEGRTAIKPNCILVYTENTDRAENYSAE
jgi:hypothetical protein